MRKRTKNVKPVVKAPWVPRDYLFGGIILSVVGGFLLAAGMEADTDGRSVGLVAAIVLLSAGGVMLSIGTIAYGVFAGMDYYHSRAAEYDFAEDKV